MDILNDDASRVNSGRAAHSWPLRLHNYPSDGIPLSRLSIGHLLAAWWNCRSGEARPESGEQYRRELARREIVVDDRRQSSRRRARS